MATESRIIKAAQSRNVKLAAFNTTDTLEETQRRIEEARAEIVRMQHEAQEQARQLAESAQKEGFDKGYADGLGQGQAAADAKFGKSLAEAVEKQVGERTAGVTQALADVTSRLAEARDHWLGHWERWAIELCCAIAGRIVRHEVAKPNDVARKILAEALALVGRCPELTIYLHPIDAETVDFDQDRWRSITHAVGDVKVLTDETLSPGGCRLESRFGSIDADLDTQLARFERELTGKGDE